MSPAKYLDSHGLLWANRGEHTDDHLSHGGHESYLIDIALNYIPDEGVVIDAGAHVGLWTMRLSAAKNVLVHAFEASPATFETLERNARRNRAIFRQAPDLYCKALWSTHADLTLSDPNGKVEGGSTTARPYNEHTDPRSSVVKAVPLDMYEFKPDFMKIDVEGAEAHVLLGARRTIMKYAPVLLIEMHDMYYGEKLREDVLRLLDSFDYEWNDDLVFGGSYYILARPREAVDDLPPIEVIHAGEEPKP